MNRFRNICLMTIVVVVSLAACNGGLPAQPIAPPAGNPLPSIVVPTPTTPPAQQEAGSKYSINLTNNYPWEAFIFLDQVFVFSIPSQRAATYGSLTAGQHTLQVCRDPGLQACELVMDLAVTGPVNLSLGAAAGVQAVAPTPTQPPVASVTPPVSSLIPAATFTAPGVSLPTATSAPNFALTAAPGEGRFLVTIHNNYPYAMIVTMDGKHLLTIPSLHYMWHVGIKSGWHTFTFKLINGVKISEREIYIGKDTEIWMGP